MSPGAEIAIRVGAAAAIFAAMVLWEILWPRRNLSIGRKGRWPGNIGVWLVDSLLVRVLVPAAAVGAAVVAAERGWGLFHVLGWPGLLAGVAGFLILDLAIYAQHYAFHHVPVLWRLHRMHHADIDIDVTTGVRFHPFEILISIAIKIGLVLALGIPALAVVAFEVVLNATSMFNHANVTMPRNMDRVLRLIVVTPDMHRVHHSIYRHETDSNFGFNLPWWDWLFRTYRAQPRDGHTAMDLGIPQFRRADESRLDRLLTQPFRDDRPA